MSKLTVFSQTGAQLSYTNNPAEIASKLEQVGIVFTRWPAKHAIKEGMRNEEILATYQEEIDAFVEEGGYLSVDSINIHPNHPDKVALREKFLSEHTHNEDEIRFFVSGQGLFSLHIEDKIYSVLCCQNDLISVPAGTLHWFDMGENPQITAIRFFNNPEGWIAKYSDSDIAKGFPLLA